MKFNDNFTYTMRFLAGQLISELSDVSFNAKQMNTNEIRNRLRTGLIEGPATLVRLNIYGDNIKVIQLSLALVDSIFVCVNRMNNAVYSREEFERQLDLLDSMMEETEVIPDYPQ